MEMMESQSVIYDLSRSICFGQILSPAKALNYWAQVNIAHDMSSSAMVDRNGVPSFDVLLQCIWSLQVLLHAHLAIPFSLVIINNY